MTVKKGETKGAEKLVDLKNGTSIWRVSMDLIREQDKNARIMSLDKFDRLTANIKKDNRLESLPLCVKKINQAENEEFLIISGHHRTRAARAAGIKEIIILVIEDELTLSEIKSKQLAHNALSGFDNVDVLKEIYDEIDDVNEKLASGVTDIDLKIPEMPSIKSDDIDVFFDFEILNILFLPKTAEKFDTVLDLIDKEAKIYLADKADFERLRTQIQAISKRENVRNISAIMARMLEIVEKYHKEYPYIEPKKKEVKKEKKKNEGSNNKKKSN